MTLLDQEDHTQIDDNRNYLAEYVGEDKKFKDVNELAKGKFHSDTYIPILEQRLDQERKEREELEKEFLRLKNEYEAGPSIQERIDQMLANQLQNREPPRTEQPVVQPTPIDPNQISSIVSSEVQKLEQKRKQDDNYRMVQDRLREQLGNRYQEVLKSKVEALGLSPQEVDDMARRNPNLFFKTFDLDQTQRQTETFTAPPKSSARPDQFVPTGNQKRTWSYYQKMRKESPELYRNPQIALQMQKDAMALGEEFNDGDWSTVSRR